MRVENVNEINVNSYMFFIRHFNAEIKSKL